MFPRFNSLDRLRMQERCVNRTKSARRSVSTELVLEGLVFILFVSISVLVITNVNTVAQIKYIKDQVYSSSYFCFLSNLGVNALSFYTFNAAMPVFDIATKIIKYPYLSVGTDYFAF